MRIGHFDSWNERDNIMSVGAFERRTKVVDLAHTVAIPNEPNDMWRFARDALLEFGCSQHQAAQLMSNTKDIRQLQGCEDLDPDVHVLRAFLGRCAHRGRLHLHGDPAYRPAVEECIKTGIVCLGPDEIGLTQTQIDALERELASPRGGLSKNHANLISANQNEFRVSADLLAMLMPMLLLSSVARLRPIRFATFLRQAGLRSSALPSAYVFTVAASAPLPLRMSAH